MKIPTIPADFSTVGDGAPTLHIVLIAPEIPPNTGNIARLCAGTQCWLHLVEPIGFELDDKHLRRAGLDYWPAVRLSVHKDAASLLAEIGGGRVHLFTARAERLYSEVRYAAGDVLVFGSESSGLPKDLLEAYRDRRLKLPTTDRIRSLNLSNTVAVAIYEVIRQRGWGG